MIEPTRRAALHVRRWTLAIMIACGLSALAGLSSCSYRLAGVKPLGEPVRVVVSFNEARLVRLQGYLQEEVAAVLESKLGWRVSPTGSAKIELFIEEEKIDAHGKDTRGIASRWTITCSGQVLLTSKRGNVHAPWRGAGYSSGLADEATALQQAARNAAELIAAWLENQAEGWTDEKP
ncbi:MAG TPA: hypothetical protein VHX44_13445 [Planctomycetota bacterium]|jgi:hypothetical protein|nr:hypothetical protein [Planctomycetota bacterium]